MQSTIDITKYKLFMYFIVFGLTFSLFVITCIDLSHYFVYDEEVSKIMLSYCVIYAVYHMIIGINPFRMFVHFLINTSSSFSLKVLGLWIQFHLLGLRMKVLKAPHYLPIVHVGFDIKVLVDTQWLHCQFDTESAKSCPEGNLAIHSTNTWMF